MKSKKVWNIVFFKYYENNREMKKACIFYRDGSVEETTYEEGLNACETIVKERKITSKNAFKEMINKDIVHVMSAEDLKLNFDKYICREVLTQDIISDAIEEEMDEIRPYDRSTTKENRTSYVVTPPITREERRYEEETNNRVYSREEPRYDDHRYSYSKYEEKEPERVVVEKAPEPPKKKGLWERITKSDLGVRISAFTLAALVGLGVYSCAKKQTLTGDMFRTNIITNDAIPEDFIDSRNEKVEETTTKVEETSVEDTINITGITYNKYYGTTRNFITNVKNQNNSIKYFIDIHRDGIKKSSSTVTINNVDYAKLLFVIAESNPNYKENENEATKLSNIINSTYNGLSRGIFKRTDEITTLYNQDISKYVFLIEIGGNENTFEEVENTISVLSDALTDYIKEDN